MAKSLLYQPGAPHVPPSGCVLSERREVPVTLRKSGRLYRFVVRDKIGPSDVYLVLVKAAAFAIQQGEPYRAVPPARSLRDVLIKLDVVV
jgi:hypothetical protein